MKSVLITGCSGFLGLQLVRLLREHTEMHLHGCDLSAPGDPSLLDSFQQADLATTQGRKALVDLVERVRPDEIHHLAGVFRGDPALMTDVNVAAAAALLEGVRQHVPEARVLLVGSAAEYGAPHSGPFSESDACRPANMYGATKLAQTIIGQTAHRQHGLSVLVARPFNIFGPGIPESLFPGRILAQAAKAMSGDGVVRMGPLGAVRDYLPSSEICRAFAGIMSDGSPGAIYNVCSGTETRIRDLANRILEAFPSPLELEESGGDTGVSIAIGDPGRFKTDIGVALSMDLEPTIRQAVDHILAS